MSPRTRKFERVSTVVTTIGNAFARAAWIAARSAPKLPGRLVW
jgi:hypothetical protein